MGHRRRDHDHVVFALGVRDQQGTQSNSVWAVVSIVPLVVAVLRYAVNVDQGNASEPDEIALGDRILQVLGLAWIASVALTTIN